jgi:hypothetical protein
MEQPPTVSKKASGFPLSWVLAVNCGAVLLAIRYYWIPKGKEIRPMGDAILVFMLVVAGLAGILLVLPTLFKHRRSVWPWFVVALSFCPYPLFMLIFHHAQQVRGFILEP